MLKQDQVIAAWRHQVRVEGGTRNKKIADHAKMVLEQKSRDLVVQLQPFKKHSDSNIRDNAFYVERSLRNTIDEVGQLMEFTQQNRNLVDGLGLETKPWHGEPLSAEEGKEIIGIHETWRDVGDDNEADSGGEKKISFDQISETEQTDKGTDSDSVNGSQSNASVSNSPKSLSSRSSSMSLGNDNF